MPGGPEGGGQFDGQKARGRRRGRFWRPGRRFWRGRLWRWSGRRRFRWTRRRWLRAVPGGNRANRGKGKGRQGAQFGNRRAPSLQSLAAADEHDVLRLWEGLGYYRRARTCTLGGSVGCRAPWRVAFHASKRLAPRSARRRALYRGRDRVDRVRRPHAHSRSEHRAVAQPAGRVRGRSGEHRGPPLPLATGRSDSAARNCRSFNQALMELGSLICTPRNPRCESCPLAGQCASLLGGRQHEIPRRASQGAQRGGVRGRRGRAAKDVLATSPRRRRTLGRPVGLLAISTSARRGEARRRELRRHGAPTVGPGRPRPPGPWRRSSRRDPVSHHAGMLRPPSRSPRGLDCRRANGGGSTPRN